MPLSTAEDPTERDLHEAEHEPFHPRGGLQTESPVGGYLPDEPDVEVADQGCKYHEHSVLLHEREGQMLPAEVVVLHVEGALRCSTLVVELHNLLTVGTTVHPRLVHLDAIGIQLGECPLQSLRLLQLHTGIAVAVLDVERVEVELRNAGEVAEGLLVGVGRVIFLGGDELVVVVEDQRLVLFHHSEL